MCALLDVRNLDVSYPSGPFWNRKRMFVVRDVTFRVGAGETVGLIGESGSGKSTIARAIMGLAPVTSGTIQLAGQGPRPRHVQMIFQDPFASLDPRMSIGRQITEVLTVHDIGNPADRAGKTRALLNRVRLPADAYDRLPSAFSGGQRARIGIARALAANPGLLIADEATAALDVSVQAQILNLLMDLRDDMNLSLLFITHDLSVVRILCDRAIVLRQGTVVEQGITRDLFSQPKHPYTRALLEAHRPLGTLADHPDHDRT